MASVAVSEMALVSPFFRCERGRRSVGILRVSMEVRGVRDVDDGVECG